MTRTFRNCAAGIVLLLSLPVTGMRAWAQGTPTPATAEPTYLPFVDASGVVSQNLRRSAVVKALGPPQEDAKVPLLRYPQLGLSFALPNDGTSNQRWGSDPAVLWMQVMPPSKAQTFGGLQLGQPQAAAVEILTRDYKLTAKVMGPRSGAPPIAMRVTDRDQRTKRELEVRFEGGAVSGLSFVTHDPPKARDATRRTLFELPPHLLVIALAATALSLAATFLADRAGWRRRWRFPGRLAGPVGLAAMGLGLVVLLVSLGWMRDSDAVTRFVGLLGLAVAAGVGLLSLSIMAQSDSRAFAWPGKAGLALVIVAILLDQTGWFWP